MFNCIANANNLLIQDLKGGNVRTTECYTTSRSANKQDHLVIEVGPDDRSVLYMSDRYRSDDIWSSEVKYLNY